MPQTERKSATWFSAVFYRVCRFAVRCGLKVCFGARAYGADRVPRHGALLLAANHQSFLDPPTIGVLVPQRPLEFVARASLFKSSVFGWIISNLNAIPLKDEAGDAGAIKEVLRRLELGKAVLIFPEGSRTPDGEMHEFKRGIALLMKRAKCPVLPVAIAGAYERWPMGSKVRWRGPRVRVLYGSPIPFDEVMKNGADAALERVRAEVVKLKAELDAMPG